MIENLNRLAIVIPSSIPGTSTSYPQELTLEMDCNIERIQHSFIETILGNRPECLQYTSGFIGFILFRILPLIILVLIAFYVIKKRTAKTSNKTKK